MSKPSTAPAILTAEQCRAARAVLKMTYLDMQAETQVAQGTLNKFEAGGEVRASILARLQTAFEAHGIVFTPDGRGLTW